MNQYNTISENNSGKDFQGLILEAWRLYSDLGIDTLPIQPYKKGPPLVSSWQSRSQLELWKTIPPAMNLGIRCGGDLNLTVIDCDEEKHPSTFENVKTFLATMNLLPSRENCIWCWSPRLFDL